MSQNLKTFTYSDLRSKIIKDYSIYTIEVIMRRSSYSLRSATTLKRIRRHRQNLKDIRRGQRERRTVFFLKEQETE